MALKKEKIATAFVILVLKAPNVRVVLPTISKMKRISA